jgi:ATP/maltotriose-dependent transcriptional regulator MalT
MSRRADVPWFAQATAALVCADCFAEARAALDAGVLESRRTVDPALFAACHAHRAWMLLRQGDLRGAEADARTVLEAGELAAPVWYRKLAAATLAAVVLQQGRLAPAEAILRELDADMLARTQTSAVLRSVRGRLRLAQRRPAEALADLLAAGEVAAATGSSCPAYLPWRSSAALVHVALGDREAALRLVDEEVALARAFGAPRTLGATLRTAGVIAGDEERLRESLACLAGAEVALERARTLAALGARLRRDNRRTEARALLREALDVAHHAGAEPLRDRVETELRATGARPRRAVLTGVDALTASERRVAELAVEGLTNREIAQALFVTMRTVEGHLSGAFAKLGVRSRTELAPALSSPG